MSKTILGNLEGKGLTIGVVVSRWNTDITSELQAGAERALLVSGVEPDRIFIAEVPGAFEIPIACQALAERGCDAVVALGCVIKGETAHFEYVSDAAMQGIRSVALATGVPVTCGILTTYNIDQALERAGRDDNNKGSEAALSAIETVRLLQAIKQSEIQPR